MDSFFDSTFGCGNGGALDGDERMIADTASAAIIPAIRIFLFTEKQGFETLLIICKNESLYITCDLIFNQRGGEVSLYRTKSSRRAHNHN